MEELQEKILELKSKRDAVILAHYYVDDKIQEIADYVGDSFYLAKIAKELTNKVICFCGVKFMAESAKILNPDKMVLLPEIEADCAMAHMVDYDKIEAMRREHPGIQVVTYINSTAKTKTFSDVCVTSSNAVKIVRNLDAKEIFFIPDQNLGSYVKNQVPEKTVYLNDGYCPVHHEITVEDVAKVKAAHPGVKILAHPECRGEILREADYIGSTSGILKYATESPDQSFIIGTEFGVAYALQRDNPQKKFYPIRPHMVCKDMKKTTLQSVYRALDTLDCEIHVDKEVSEKALIPLERMLELAK